MSAIVEPHVHRWTRDEYYTMAEAGLFRGNRVELIEGQVVEMSPMGSAHATAIVLAGNVLEDAFAHGYVVRWQMPLALSKHSEPEPDIAVVRGNVRDYAQQHPDTAVLVVEVSDTSLGYDRTTKAALYAEAGIEEYWIVNLVEHQMEVCRQPQPAPEGYGYRYADIVVLSSTERVTPHAAPSTSILVADLLP